MGSGIVVVIQIILENALQVQLGQDEHMIQTIPLIGDGYAVRLHGHSFEQVMPADCCFAVPDSLNNDEVTIAEPLSIGLYATGLAPENPPKRAAILGAGPIGLSVLLSLRAAGTEEIPAEGVLSKGSGILAPGAASDTGVDYLFGSKIPVSLGYSRINASNSRSAASVAPD